MWAAQKPKLLLARRSIDLPVHLPPQNVAELSQGLPEVLGRHREEKPALRKLTALEGLQNWLHQKLRSGVIETGALICQREENGTGPFLPQVSGSKSLVLP